MRRRKREPVISLNGPKGQERRAGALGTYAGKHGCHRGSAQGGRWHCRCRRGTARGRRRRRSRRKVLRPGRFCRRSGILQREDRKRRCQTPPQSTDPSPAGRARPAAGPAVASPSAVLGGFSPAPAPGTSHAAAAPEPSTYVCKLRCLRSILKDRQGHSGPRAAGGGHSGTAGRRSRRCGGQQHSAGTEGGSLGAERRHGGS